MKELPTEYFEGDWHFAKESNPPAWAVVTYTEEPSPETGHVGWCWWALGKMGDAETYELACEAAVNELMRISIQAQNRENELRKEEVTP